MTRKNNQNALKHGGESGVKALTTGADFHGPAIIARAEAQADYDRDGADAMIREAALRLEAIGRLYFDAIQLESQRGASVAQIDGYVARAGWLISKSLLAWQAVRQIDTKKNTRTLDAILNKGANDE